MTQPRHGIIFDSSLSFILMGRSAAGSSHYRTNRAPTRWWLRPI